ncbi:MAG: sulfur transferase domain-containing protein [Planctomycetota bacterium]
MSSKLFHSLPSLLVALIAASCAETAPPTSPSAHHEVAPIEDATLGSTAKVHRVGDLWLTSEPSSTDLALAAKEGVHTFIDLRHDAETPDVDTGAVATAAGLVYVNVPFGAPAELTDAIFDRVRAELSTAQRPAILSCKSSNRVGAVWLTYRVLDEGVPFETALEEARTAGLRTPEYEALAKAYVDAHR